MINDRHKDTIKIAIAAVVAMLAFASDATAQFSLDLSKSHNYETSIQPSNAALNKDVLCVSNAKVSGVGTYKRCG